MKRFSQLLLGLLLMGLGPVVPAGATPQARVPPVPGSVLRGFSPGEFDWSPGHRGVDLAAGSDAPVRAAWSGVVAWVGVIDQVPMVSVDHPDGTRTTHQPVIAVVSPGQRVHTGEVIGRLTGTHCAPDSCLHWGVRRGERYLDPLLWLGTDVSRVRLLPASATPRTTPPAVRGALLEAPVAGPITSGFDMRTNPISGRSEFHDGVDIGAPCGAVVTLRARGIVIRAGTVGGYGLRVEVDHLDGRVTSYSHLSRIDVVAGQHLAPGTPLGLVGTTGYSTGCHLHYSLVRDQTPVDPLSG